MDTFLATAIIAVVLLAIFWARLWVANQTVERGLQEARIETDLIDQAKDHPSLREHVLGVEHEYYVQVPYWVQALLVKQGARGHTHSRLKTTPAHPAKDREKFSA